MTKKIAINRCFGGFGLSHDAVVRYHELKGNTIVIEYDKPFDIYHYYLNISLLINIIKGALKI